MREHRWKSRLVVWGIAAAGVVLGLGAGAAGAQMTSPAETGILPNTIIGANDRVTVTGVVKDEATGAPIERASVIHDRESLTTPVLTNAAGAFAIPDLHEGPHQILIAKEGYYPLSRIINVVAGQTTSFEFPLRAISTAAGQSTIAGKVTDAASGDPLAGAIVTYAPADLQPGDPDGLLAEAGVIRPPNFVLTNEAGEYKIEGLAAGAYGVSARAEGRLAKGARVEVAEGATALRDFALDPLPMLALGSIQGIVVADANGAPVAEAAVHVRPFMPAPEGSFNDPAGPNDPMLNLAEVPRVHSRDGGYFRIHPLYVGSYELIVRAPNFLPARALVDVRPGEAAIAQLRLRRESAPEPGVVEGRVVDARVSVPGQSPVGIAGATVHLLSAVNIDLTLDPANSPATPQGVTTTTDENGHYRFEQVPAGVYLLVAGAEGYLRGDRLIRLDPNGHVVADLALHPVTNTGQGTLEGVVGAAQTQTPIVGARVVVTGLNSTSPSGVIGQILAEATTDEQGRYRVEGLPAGGYLVTAGAEGYLPKSLSAQVIGGQVTHINFALSPQTQIERGRIEGVVSDASTQAPIAGALVHAAPLIPPNGDPAILVDITVVPTATTDENGRYSIPDLPAGVYRMFVGGPNHQPVERDTEVSSGQTTTENFVLQPAQNTAESVISGRVVNGDPRLAAPAPPPIAGATVTLLYAGPIVFVQPPQPIVVTTGEDGAYKAEHLLPGAYNVKVEAQGFQISSRQVEAPAGGATVANFALLPLNTGATRLVGKVVNASTGAGIPNATVTASNPNTNSLLPLFTATTDEQGYFGIENIAAGGYLLTATAEGFMPANATVSVVEGQTAQVLIRLQPVNAPAASIDGEVKGAAPDANGTIRAVPLAGARVVARAAVPGSNTLQVVAETTTNDLGRYAFFGLPPGYYQISASAQGYVQAMQGVQYGGATLHVNLLLQPSVVTPQ